MAEVRAAVRGACGALVDARHFTLEGRLCSEKGSADSHHRQGTTSPHTDSLRLGYFAAGAATATLRLCRPPDKPSGDAGVASFGGDAGDAGDDDTDEYASRHQVKQARSEGEMSAMSAPAVGTAPQANVPGRRRCFPPLLRSSSLLLLLEAARRGFRRSLHAASHPLLPVSGLEN